MKYNKDIVLALGGCWHELIPYDKDGYKCSCGFETYYGGLYGDHERENPNPDFTSDAGKVQLLRELSKREDWHEFICYMIPVKNYDSYILSAIDIVKYILDTTGKLRDQAIKWLREEATDECNG